MKAAVHDFVYEKNTDWNFTIGYNTGNVNSYTPVDITGYSAVFKLYQNRYSDPVLTLTNEINLVPSEGRFNFTVSKETNAGFAQKEMYYTFEITDALNKTERILKGSIRIEI